MINIMHACDFAWGWNQSCLETKLGTQNWGSICGQDLRIRAQPVAGVEAQSGLGSQLNLCLEIEPKIE